MTKVLVIFVYSLMKKRRIAGGNLQTEFHEPLDLLEGFLLSKSSNRTSNKNGPEGPEMQYTRRDRSPHTATSGNSPIQIQPNFVVSCCRLFIFVT